MASYVFIHPLVQDWDVLLNGIVGDYTVVVLNRSDDGVTQIARALDGVADLDAIHIISHGSEGALHLGRTLLNDVNLSDYATQLEQIGAALSVDGDVLLYGCNVAGGTIGQDFIAKFAQYTGADVAASTNLTGAAMIGGDWTLESSTGPIKDTVPLSTTAQATFSNTLDVNSPFALTSESLRDAINLSIASYGPNTTNRNADAPTWKLVSRQDMGISDPSLFASNSDYLFSRTTLLPLSDAQAIVAVNDAGDELAIAFRGSQETPDWLTDLLAGTVTTFSVFYDLFAPLLVGVDTYLNDHIGITKVLVTGHSLGGAFVELYMDQHGDANRHYLGVTFGSPGNNILAYGSFEPDARLFNFWHSGDLVHDLTLANVNQGIDIAIDRLDISDIDLACQVSRYEMREEGIVL